MYQMKWLPKKDFYTMVLLKMLWMADEAIMLMLLLKTKMMMTMLIMLRNAYTKPADDEDDA